MRRRPHAAVSPNRKSMLTADRYGPCIYYMDRRGGLPLSRGVTAASGLISELVLGFGDVSVGIYRSVEKGTKPVSTTTDLEVITSRSEGQSPTSPDAVKSPLSQPPSYEAKSTAPPLVGKKPSATRRGIKRISTAFLKSPIDATVAIADGLNNAPALYGDDTVRPPEEIKGIKSGLVAGGKVCQTERPHVLFDRGRADDFCRRSDLAFTTGFPG